MAAEINVNTSQKRNGEKMWVATGWESKAEWSTESQEKGSWRKMSFLRV